MAAPLTLDADLAADLAAVCATSPDLAGVETDWTGRVTGRALAHVLPASTDEVAAVLAVCRAHGVRVTVRGGGTGLVAGAVPDGTVVLSTRRLDSVSVEPDGTVLAGAGATLAAVQAAARGAGLAYGVDMASRDQATVGGTLVTDAGGLHVVAHGTTRAQVLGVEAVLADSSVVSRLGGLVKDATGYDLGHLLVGSEGTLGVVTAARLRLVPVRTDLQVALVACDGVEDAVALVGRARRELDHLSAAELMLAATLALTRAGAQPREPAPAYVLLEGAGLEPLLAGRETLLAQDAADAARLWELREGLTAAVGALGVPHKLDVSLPQDRLADFVAALPGATDPHLVHLWGHLGDGNLHVNVLGPAPDDDAVDEAVLRLAAGHGGSVGAEHGIGRAKRDHLHLSRSPAELAAMRAVKAALDPTGLLNPGVLLPAAGPAPAPTTSPSPTVRP